MAQSPIDIVVDQTTEPPEILSMINYDQVRKFFLKNSSDISYWNYQYLQIEVVSNTIYNETLQDNGHSAVRFIL